jgi:hypothetical protein
MLIILWQSPDDRLQAIAPLCRRDLLFWTGRRISMFLSRARIACGPLIGSLVREALLQRKIVGNPEKPCPEIPTRTTQVKMSKQG